MTPAPRHPHCELADVHLRRGGRPVLAAVAATLEAGSFTVIMGPNGSGKSSLLDVLAGYLRPQIGQVSLDGRSLAQWPGEVLSRRRLVLSQTLAMSTPFSVRELVELGIPRTCPLGPAEIERRLNAALVRADVAPLARRNTMALSGGELQRVHLARCLLQIALLPPGEGAVLLLDEPTAHQDLHHQEQILSTCRSLAALGHLVCAVLHDLNQVSRYADRVLLLDAGRVVLHGPAQAVLADPRLAEVFRVRLRRLEDAAGGPPVWCIDAAGGEGARDRRTSSAGTVNGAAVAPLPP
jgi:iron complex transport system ATP-binding protein